MIDFILHPWPWWLSGIVISSIMFFLLYFGQSFGFSSNLRTICSMSGLGKRTKFFDFNWKTQTWNLVFLVGAIIGGFVAHQFLSNDAPLVLADSTASDLALLGMGAPKGIQPEELFSLDAVFTVKGFAILALGGLMVGFGSRYAGGCTSGHAISGLSDLQFPSFIAVIGFFLGGIAMSHVIFPLIF
jgi:uncharacterized membrane protein YedE/YeeE